ncbi:MAG: septal ring lytic transglycosylase RlpA family protein [Bacteroidetes bacterium]|nr:septal ring lytic transglycosylase RlpA family protein [Bacteroidota bacterium]MCH7769817.1 septal ring lytic transglycosylase RlpA family protein [Bacteroidota bacterium]MCH9028983.1 septal ring lytic transglycosylase RlpA family protein [Bacteroidota bacterium]
MILVLSVIGLVGFTIATTERESSISLVLTEEFAPVPNRSSNNLLTILYKDRGTMRASWYGPRFHGRFTANGEIYNQNAMTAAHKSMKFGTILRITNPRNNKSVIVRINDRGPYIPGRQIDLSKAAAEELDVIKNGVKKLKIEEIIIKGIDNPFISLN